MLKKELIELCLLHLLSQGDQYGYEILPRLRAAFPDTQESAVYAILRALGQAGCTKRYSGIRRFLPGGGPCGRHWKNWASAEAHKKSFPRHTV